MPKTWCKNTQNGITRIFDYICRQNLLKNAKTLLNFVEIFFLNLQSGNNLLPAKNPKLFEMRWGAKLFQIGGGLESLGLNYV